MHIKYLLLIAASFLVPCALQAQDKNRVNLVETEDYDISKTPVVSETDIKHRLFSLPQEEPNFYFRVNLQDDNFFIAEFTKIGHWQGKGAIQDIFDKAASTTEAVADSFASATASKKLEIHIPIANAPLTLRLSEHAENNRIMALSGQTRHALKIGMDTISILKTYSEDKLKNTTELAQVKYTFILKNLNDIYNLKSNTTLIADIEHTLDSLVQRKRDQWMADNAWYHSMRAEYSPHATDKKRLKKEITGTGMQAFDLNVSLGATLLQNNIAANSEAGIGYRWKTTTPNRYNHVGVSLNALVLTQDLLNTPRLHNLTFVNLSFGTLYQNKRMLIPIDQVSVSVGYKIANDPHPVFDKQILRYSFNLSVSNLLTISPEYYYFLDNYDFDTGAQSGFFGISLKLKLFTVMNY